MLSSIKSITKFGVFDNHSNEVPFLRYNLIYGWNGAGKSTLSKVFDSLSGASISSFPEGNFKVSFQDREYTKENINTLGKKIATFNQDFIRNNLNFETHKAKSILYISEEKIEEKKQLEQKQSERDTIKTACDQKRTALEELNREISSEHTKIARNVKNSFGLIQTKNSKFLNYDKKKLESFLVANKEKICSESILATDEIEKKKLAAQATQKGIISEIHWLFDIKIVEKLLLKSKEIVEKSIVAAQIPKLSVNQELNKWVGAGLTIHQSMPSDNCEFCGNALSPDRIKELEAHFSNEYQALVADISQNIYDITNISKNIEFTFPDSSDFYAEFQASLRKIKEDAEYIKKIIKDKLNQIQNTIELKKNNPFDVIQWQEPNVKEDFESLINIFIEFSNLVSQHNKKTNEFVASVNNANDLLELHFISDQLTDGVLSQKKVNLQKQTEELVESEAKFTSLDAEVKALESKLVNVAIAADKFNKELENFLGRSDIELEFKQDQKGYLFYRNGRREVASNLSEGEKTAIAFIYFITKLKEGGSAIENTIVVLDDPISSFDSKNLHSAFGFIQQHLGTAKQLFVLTHNFEFFKLVRNWLKKKNENSKNAANEKSKFYLLQAKLDTLRSSEIVVLPIHLLNYESEYHFLFGKVLSFKDTATPTFEQAHFIGNGSRKVLEAFLAFKFPSYKGDFAGLLKMACGEDSSMFQRVYSFINRYSHSQTMEVFEAGSDNIFAESKNIVSDVFQIIRALDQRHHEEMEKLCS